MNLGLLTISTDHLYAEMNNKTFLCNSCNTSQNHYLWLCSACDTRSCCSCTYQRGFCICNKPYNGSTIVVENSFFTKLDDHICKIEPILETQYLTAVTRNLLTKAGINRAEQLFAKSLLDHLHRNRLDLKQAQYLVNKLAQLTHVYGAKIGKSFKS